MKTRLVPAIALHHKIALPAIAVVSIFGLAVQASQAALPTKASEDFSHLYEADLLPHSITPKEDSFILRVGTTGGPNNASNSQGVLTISSPPTSHQYYEGRSANWLESADLSDGFTAEIRVKVDPGKTFGGIQLGFAADSAAGMAGLILTGDDTQWKVSASENTIVDPAPNDDDFHVFRLIKLPTSSTQGGRFTLYRDGVLILDNVAGQDKPLDRFFFGDYGSWDSAGDVDYFRWDPTGAYAPAP